MNIPILLFLIMIPIVSQPDGILDQAIGHYEKGEYPKAVELLSTTGNSSDISAEGEFWLGKSYLKVRKWDKAVRAMEKVVQKEPSNALYHLWLGRAYGFRADNRLFGFNDARRLLKEFKKARELAPENITVRFDLLEFYVQAPGIVGGGKDKARLEAEEISKLKPIRGYIARATIHEREKKWDLAEKELIQATVDYPNEADVHKDLAQFLLDREAYERALASVQKALLLESLSKRSRLIMGASRVQLGKSLDEAEKILLDLVSGSLGDGDPSFEEVYYWLGVCYYKKGDKEKSKDAFESVIALNPEHKKAKKYLKEF